MHVDKRLIKLAHNYRLTASISILSDLFAAFLTIAQAFYLSMIIDSVFLRSKSLNDVSNLIFILILVSVLKSLFIWLGQNSANKLAVNIKSNLRQKLTRHIFKLGPSYTKGEKSGEITNTVFNGIEKLEAYFSQFLPQLFLSALIPLLILIIVFPVDLLTGVVFLVTAPLIPVFMILIGKIAESMNRKQWKILNLMSGYFLDVIQGLATIKLFGRQRDIRKKIELVSDSFRISTMKVLRIAFLSALVLEILSTISIAIVAVEIGLRLLHGNLEFRQALFILILAPEFYLPLRQLGARYHAGMEGVSAAESIFKILKEPVKISSGKNTFNPGLAKNIKVEFQNVSFSYNNTKEAVKNLSFTLNPGTVTALVGKSGSGKTTTANLLLKFIENSTGKIIVNGMDLKTLSRNDWLKFVTWIPQNPYLFHESIKYNLQLAKPGATEEEIIDAARKADIHNFINSLAYGYETIVGERGARLSGGQAQRIALARAFLKNSPLIILDEPTANLDPQTELRLLRNIEMLTKNKTVLMIAHRLNTIKKADSILVYSNGEIVESGNYNELIELNGYFTKLIKSYSGEDE